MRTLRLISFKLSLALLIASCGADSKSGMRTNFAGGNDDGTSTQSTTGDCTALRSAVETALTAINACQTTFDCVLTSGMRKAGYSCKEVGFNRTQSTTAFNAAVNSYFKGCGKSRNLTCTADVVSTNQACVNNRCVRDIDKITQ